LLVWDGVNGGCFEQNNEFSQAANKKAKQLCKGLLQAQKVPGG
jgi:hypothetical protein